MSQYIFFYIRAEDRMMPIGTFSQSHNVFQLFHDCVPYEKIAPLDTAKLDPIHDSAREYIRCTTEDLEREKAILQQIPSFSNSVEDKLDAIREQQNLVDSLEDELNEWRDAIAYVELLYQIIDVAEDTNWMEDKSLHIDPHQYLWVGIETGYKVEIPTA